MGDDLDELMISVRADTRAFAGDMQRLRGSLDSNLLDGFAKAGTLLEKGLLSAVRRGSLSFEDLKQTAFQAIDQIAAQALKLGLESVFGKGGAGGVAGGLLGGALSGLFGLPGRATGGLVAPDRPYLVGERGPEVFVPTSAGRVETGQGNAGNARRDVRVAIKLAVPRGVSAPAAFQRSSRQVASAVRRAIAE